MRKKKVSDKNNFTGLDYVTQENRFFWYLINIIRFSYT